VRDRFVQEGHRFFFPDGHAAFKDRGRRLTTASENSQVIHSLVEIARSRAWTEVTVTGTEAFRREAWRQARLANVAVRGYRPSDAEQAQLIRAMARNLARPIPEEPGADRAEASAAAAPGEPERDARGRPASLNERISGVLLEHGRDAYRHDPEQAQSYFIRLKTPAGEREVWGMDIERAVTESLSRPQVGDQVILQQSGRDRVTVKRRERDDEGRLRIGEAESFRSRWVLETRDFFDSRRAAAELLRNSSVRPQDAVRQHPELVGTYLNLRAVELAASTLRDREDQRRLVERVRGALAGDIELGMPLEPVRLRTPISRAPRPRDHELTPRSRA
jgi:hypothetical protein